ncbi:MAG: succinate dehydrogenase membrane anchor subunit [uncultured bacterium]|nr:MAG: succinate dehydrogenase membrane anchor subunit [uncultured bacterium]OGT33084.1 MAG: succinate dehydrogenase, hydrophobic membrane anchor protein [Gammaproteobacteria bacterium RIFCSPHIGHO2_02_FULL_39_13]OGT49334.1 MAG: succinate dehydrogenase, hydrophobic membrane anchor protein [Gammaproteobacteria bacterium RIFCSPHIGHO2_12_FULL_39_24]
MVNHCNNNHRGFYEWIVQRVTAILIGCYAVFLLSYLLLHQPLNYATWRDLFSCLWIKITSVIVLMAILWHAWIGLWTVFTDYVKCGVLRLILEILVILALASYLIWCVDALYG